MSASEHWTVGFSLSLLSGMTGRTCFMAQLSAADWKTEKLQRYCRDWTSARCESSSETCLLWASLSVRASEICQ